ncbi:uncharacterized protein [Triticum aestivum]|uniref:uncharacterized protein isoform X1 n=1 Tax=Triticum aestivum TaxID=4565 RepID=UPI001D018024|nr:uncharacterized protein LOC123094924 isoform X1 [Triticum aestivum]
MSAVRSKCSGGQYGEAQRPLGLREVQGRKQPIRRAVPVRRPYDLRGVLDLAPTPPTRAGHPPVRRPHPHHQAPQRRPRLPVASEDFQINTEAPCRSQRLAKYNTTTRQVALLVCGAEAMSAPFLAKTFLQMI